MEHLMELSNPDVAQYVKLWYAIFGEFLGWTRAEVIRWAEQYETEIKEDRFPFNHETPVYYVTPVLVPQSIRSKMHGFELIHFENRLESTIKGYGEPLWAKPDEYDWKAAKQRVESILNEYGESLANVAAEQRGQFDYPGR
jgi:hypothetical protein